MTGWTLIYQFDPNNHMERRLAIQNRYCLWDFELSSQWKGMDRKVPIQGTVSCVYYCGHTARLQCWLVTDDGQLAKSDSLRTRMQDLKLSKWTVSQNRFKACGLNPTRNVGSTLFITSHGKQTLLFQVWQYVSSAKGIDQIHGHCGNKSRSQRRAIYLAKDGSILSGTKDSGVARRAIKETNALTRLKAECHRWASTFDVALLHHRLVGTDGRLDAK